MQEADINAVRSRTPAVPMRLRDAEYEPIDDVITVTRTHRLMEDEVVYCRKSALREICSNRLGKLVPRWELLAAKGGAIVALVPAVAQSNTQGFWGIEAVLVENFLMVALWLMVASLARDLTRLISHPERFGTSIDDVVQDILADVEGRERARSYWCRLREIFK